MASRPWAWAWLLAAALAVPAEAQTLRARMIAAEDARVATDAAIEPILQGVRGADPALVVRGTRALGRFERPAFVRHLLPLVTHMRPDVRREAATALAQSLARVSRAPDAQDRPPELTTVTTTLLARLGVERDPYVVGALGESLGRLPYRSPAIVRDVERALVMLLPAGETAGGRGAAAATAASAQVALQPGAITGIVKGLDSLIRFNQKIAPPAPETIARLRAAATQAADPADADLAVVRRVAWSAVNTATAADAMLVERGIEDPDAQVRRHAVVALVNGRVGDDERKVVLTRAFADASFNVRLEAVRVYSRTLQRTDCAPILRAAADLNMHVALAAIDALGNGCPSTATAVAALTAIADDQGIAWHKPAHAFVSLARTSREEAVQRLPRFAEHALPLVRAYAARAATELLAAARLERLAADPDDNVRYEAVIGLRRVRGHEADAVFIEALKRSDYQLLMAAAQALEGSTRKTEAVPALLDAFTRLTASGRETSRDPRLAIVVRLRELGSAANVAALQRCLTDFDPAVAEACAAAIQAWTNVAPPLKPVPLKPQPVFEPLPTQARVVMRGGGVFSLRLLPEDATATVARFARLARQGYYNGLTIHRVAPNFVIQGGSPGANEYAGDGPFMRDELGLRSNVRGTVGVSTRGRDTGDAQFFVNLIDNHRLDHDFTVFAEITAGLDVVDAILEGDVIERIEIL